MNLYLVSAVILLHWIWRTVKHAFLVSFWRATVPEVMQSWSSHLMTAVNINLFWRFERIGWMSIGVDASQLQGLSNNIHHSRVLDVECWHLQRWCAIQLCSRRVWEGRQLLPYLQLQKLVSRPYCFFPAYMMQDSLHFSLPLSKLVNGKISVPQYSYTTVYTYKLKMVFVRTNRGRGVLLMHVSPPLAYVLGELVPRGKWLYK